MARRGRKSDNTGVLGCIGILILISVIIVLLPIIFIGSLIAAFYFHKKDNPKLRNIAIGVLAISSLSWFFIGDSNNKNTQETSVKSGIVSTTNTKEKSTEETIKAERTTTSTTTENKTRGTESTSTTISTSLTTTEKTTMITTAATILTEAPTTQAPIPIVTTTEAPAPVQNFAATPTPESPATQVYYQNCTAVRNAGAAPIYSGDPGYGPHLDRDGDGVACE